jgi:hypothetical protein
MVAAVDDTRARADDNRAGHEAPGEGGRRRLPEGVRLAAGLPAAALFGLVAAVRHARALHPVGVAFGATLALDGPGADLVPELGEPGRRRPGIVRLSRGGGLPEGKPDVHGVALKLPAGAGAERDQDLLVSSSGRSRLGRRLLSPARSFDGVWATTLTSFRAGGRKVVFAVEVLGSDEGGVDRPPLTVEHLRRHPGDGPELALLVATPTEPWAQVGTVTLRGPLTPEEEDGLAFSPWEHGDGIMPVGALNALRDGAYRASRLARAHRWRRPAALRRASTGRSVRSLRRARRAASPS